MRIMVTGAAGFIGGAVAAELRRRGHDVLAVDAYIAQAHAADRAPVSDVRSADVRDHGAIRHLLSGVDVVCHQAAMVGAGVSPPDLPLFASHNDLGTATLLAAMADAGVNRLLLASSMVVYGDGRYECADHGPQQATRTLDDLRAGRFDSRCPHCGSALDWRLVDEDAPLRPRSSYAASKVAQEHFAAAWSQQAEGAVIALRYHNVYGPGMPADTPYSGVAAIFRSDLEADRPPRVFEDGAQMRDFVHVSDVVTANLLSLDVLADRPAATFDAYNVCSGRPVSIAEVARLVTAGSPRQALEPVVTGQFRPGDVRHIVASSAKAFRDLGFAATVAPEEGLPRFARDPLRPAAATTR